MLLSLYSLFGEIDQVELSIAMEQKEYFADLKAYSNL
jgi:hypothetical protein